MDLDRGKADSIDTTIKSLEQSSKSLEEFSTIFNDLAELKADVQIDLKMFNGIAIKLDTITASIDDRFQNTTQQVADLADSIEQSQKKQAHHTISGLKAFSTKLEEQIGTIKTVFRELDGTLLTRLDKHSSDIQVTIRNEGTQTQNALAMTISSELSKSQTTITDTLKRQQKSINILTGITVLLTIACVAGIYLNYIK